jgi:IS605 OrfB family transposase
MKYRSRKNNTDYINFEDCNFPTWIKNIKSRYWYTTPNRRRVIMSFKNIFTNTQKRGLEIIYEKDTNRYFLHYPVDINWFPEDDRRNEKQVKYVPVGNRVISLDPGVRKFLVGYDPNGSISLIGEGASFILTNLLYQIDKTTCKDTKRILWRKMKNLISELHWKVISYLIENYDTIILPEFRVSEMIKGKKLKRITKRLMCMFSFYTFRQKLTWKCKTYNKKLVIVDESYTSKTCICGCLNDMNGKEIYKCKTCGFTMDRDILGSLNILIKNIKLNA